MKRKEIRAFLETLAQSQGSYGRLLNLIDSMPTAQQERTWKTLEEQNFKDNLDIVFYFET